MKSDQLIEFHDLTMDSQWTVCDKNEVAKSKSYRIK